MVRTRPTVVGVDGFAVFHERLQPAEDPSPAQAMSCGLFRVTCESFLSDFYQRSSSDAMGAGLMQAVDGSSSNRTVVFSLCAKLGFHV